jgi:predicted MFS family arabinose efflux permease
VLTPWLLLLLTFGLGACSAMSSTVRQASVSDVVPRVAMVAALGFSGVAYNGARAVGPALAGMLLVWHGTSAVFAAIVLLFALTLLIQLLGYDPPVSSRLPAERPLAAMRSGLRYVWYAPHLHAPMIRTIVFVGAASSLLALLPVVARDNPLLGASGYATMLGCMGAGAVASGVALGWLRARYSLDSMATVAGYVYAGAIFSTALIASLPVLCVALFAGGTAWVLNNSALNAAYQTSLPSWVRARALSIRLLVFQGSMAAGSVVWGAIASHWGCTEALCGAGALTLAGLLITTRYRIVLGREDDFALADDSHAAPHQQAKQDDGPLEIAISYRVETALMQEFLAAISLLGTARRRNGARAWRLYNRADAPDHFVERYTVASLDAHNLMQQRITRSEATLENAVRAHHADREPVRTTRLVLVQTKRRGTAMSSPAMERDGLQ